MTWTAQSVRFVLYQSDSAPSLDAEDVWKKIFPSRRPSNTQRQQDVPGLPQSIAMGVVREHQLTVSVAPKRLDFFVAPSNSNWLTSDAGLVDPSGMIEPGIHYGRKLIDEYQLVRIALVVDLFQRAEDAYGASNKVYDELSFLPRLPKTRDIAIQINPAKPFECTTEQSMNRLCRWASGVTQTVNISAIQGMVGVGPTEVVTTASVYTMQLDMSSEQSRTMLEPTLAKNMLTEIEVETRKIIGQGFEAFL